MIVEYADPSVATTHIKLGTDKLKAMTDEQLLEYWNEHVSATEEFRQDITYTAIELPIGKSQVEYCEEADQWVPRGHVLRCEVVTSGSDREPDDPFVSIDGRVFTISEFVKMVSTFEGWGMRIVFVPDDELHEVPKIKAEDVGAKQKTPFKKRRT